MRRVFFLAAILAGPLPAQDVTGLWLGTIRSGPTSLRIAVHINRNADGLNGTLDSLDQGANGIPMSSVIQQGKSVKLEVQQVGGSYAGTLSADASEMERHLDA